jgi:hypothetical protein
VSVEEDTCSGEFGTLCQTVETVQLKKMSGGSSDCGEPHNLNSLHAEVVAPRMHAGVKKCGQLSGRRVRSSDIATLPKVANHAAESQVALVSPAAMLLRNDMIDLMRAGCKILRKQTVLAATLSTVKDQLSGRL